MADNEKAEQTTSSGNEWEVVSLTASTYAAAPGPDGVESVHEDNKDGNTTESEAETSQALFNSQHFVFPPGEHENLAAVPDNEKVHKEEKVAEPSAETLAEEGDLSEKKGEEKWNATGLDVPEVLDSIYEDKFDRLSIYGAEFDEGKALHELNVAGTEPDMYNSGKLGSLCDETERGASIYDESKDSSDFKNPTEVSLDSSDGSLSADKGDDPELPPGAWWKRQVASLCAHATETNAVWSVFIAAAVMGLVMLGKRWQHERWQVAQQRWHVSINAEKPGRMLGPLSRFKDLFVGSQRASYMKNAIAAER